MDTSHSKNHVRQLMCVKIYFSADFSNIMPTKLMGEN